MVKTNLFDLSGKVALVTGGASGIGKAIAAVLVQHGARVMIGSRTRQKVDEAARELDGMGPAGGEKPVVVGISLDVTSANSVDHAICRAVDRFGRLNILVNSAGNMLRKPTFELSTDEFNSLHETHVTGTLRCCQAAGHLFREQHEGCIINIASVGSFVDLVEVAAYAAAKNAILGLTRSLANEWAKHGIRVNAIAPGFVPTDLNRKMIEKTERGRRIMEHTPMGRFGEAAEIAGAAVYLASSAATFTTGHTIVIDGGYLACGIGESHAPWAE